MLSNEDDNQEGELGGFRETQRGIYALAKTFGYDLVRVRKGFQMIEEAKTFVESFRPREPYNMQDVTEDPEVRLAFDSS